MKIKPTTYAQFLIASLADKPDFKDLARRLWYMLQKNKQYRDLPKILDELEKVYAAEEGFTIAYVESGKELSAEQLEAVREKLSFYCHFDSPSGAEKSCSKNLSTAARDDKRIIIKSKVNPSVTGIIAKIDNQVIDLSVEDKISKLRKELNK